MKADFVGGNVCSFPVSGHRISIESADAQQLVKGTGDLIRGAANFGGSVVKTGVNGVGTGIGIGVGVGLAGLAGLALLNIINAIAYSATPYEAPDASIAGLAKIEGSGFSFFGVPTSQDYFLFERSGQTFAVPLLAVKKIKVDRNGIAIEDFGTILLALFCGMVCAIICGTVCGIVCIDSTMTGLVGTVLTLVMAMFAFAVPLFIGFWLNKRRSKHPEARIEMIDGGFQRGKMVSETIDFATVFGIVNVPIEDLFSVEGCMVKEAEELRKTLLHSIYSDQQVREIAESVGLMAG